MRQKYRFHAIAIGIICTIIVALFFIMKPARPVADADQPLLGDRYIQIYGATWGEECNRYLDANATSTPMKKDEKGMLIASAPKARVMPNNVLDMMSAACNGKLTCTMRASSATMGIEPLESCYKQLKVSYRCYAFDRLWNRTAKQGETFTIDCNETAVQPKQ